MTGISDSDSDLTARIVGVVDLLGGRAVHAVAGHRDEYRELERWSGDPLALVEHYGRLGIGSFYVADLDAILGADPNTSTIGAICEVAGQFRSPLADHRDPEVLVDIGWSGAESAGARVGVGELSARFASLRWIAATESCRHLRALDGLAQIVSPQRLFLGLDYRRGRLMTATPQSPPETDWVLHASRIGYRGTVVLDLAAVGCGQGPSTIETCSRVRRLAPQLAVYSGGGLRTAEDVRHMIRAGADRCLMATALHREATP